MTYSKQLYIVVYVPDLLDALVREGGEEWLQREHCVNIWAATSFDPMGICGDAIAAGDVALKQTASGVSGATEDSGMNLLLSGLGLDSGSRHHLE